MHFQFPTVLCVSLWTAKTFGSSTAVRPEHVPTVWIAGDSTTAPGGGHNGTEGWAQYLRYSFGENAKVDNSAYAGRSIRSFTREGRFDRIAEKLVAGDWVVIEFGINDAGAVQNGSTSSTGDKGRSPCPGIGNETCTVIFKYRIPL